MKTQNFKVDKQTLLSKIRPYYVKSQGYFSKNTPFLWFHWSVKICEMLEKRPLSSEIEKEDTYTTSQTMTLPAPVPHILTSI